MESQDDSPVKILVVGGPARERLFERFQRVYDGRHDVRVVMERRVMERRRAGAAQRRPPGAAVERRRAERRTSAPWLVVPSD